VHSHLQVPALGSAPARAAVSVWCTAEAHIQLAPSIVEVAVGCAVEARTTAAPGAPSRVVTGRSQPGD
jgi:hypothetical protein